MRKMDLFSLRSDLIAIFNYLEKNKTEPDCSNCAQDMGQKASWGKGKKTKLHTKKKVSLVKEVKRCKGCPEVMLFWTSLRIEIKLNKASGNLS